MGSEAPFRASALNRLSKRKANLPVVAHWRITMRHFDFSPLYRATVGFDQVADMMDRIMASDGGQPSYPPYNIEKTADDSYRISLAVAGFASDELNVEVKERALVVWTQEGRRSAARISASGH